MTTSTTRGRDPASVRRHNLRALLQHLHLQGPTSRAELCDITGLTRSAIADLVSELATRGLAVEGTGESGQSPSGRGRPSMIVSPCVADTYVLAVAVEVDTIRLSRVGFGGSILTQTQTTHDYVPGEPARSVKQLAALIDEWIRSAPAPPIGLGVAVPGLVREEDGLITRAPNLDWHNVSLGDELQRATQLSGPIVIGNEARLAALAEQRRGAGRECGDLVYVSAEVGVGGGIVTHDYMLTGHTGYSGEIGHMITNPNGRDCHCGARGCWETEIGADAFLRYAGVPAPVDRHAALDDLLTRAEQRETQPLAAFRALCTPVAIGLANLLAIFNPERVILGGLLEPMMRHTGTQLQATLEQLRGLPEVLADLRPAQLGEHGRVLGAAEAAVNRFLAHLT